MARMGLRLTSKASSVIDRSVTRTGTTRWRDQTNSVSGCSIGRISSVPEPARAWLLEGVGAGLHQRLERGELRGGCRARVVGAVLVGVLERVGGVDLGLEP